MFLIVSRTATADKRLHYFAWPMVCDLALSRLFRPLELARYKCSNLLTYRADRHQTWHMLIQECLRQVNQSQGQRMAAL